MTRVRSIGPFEHHSRGYAIDGSTKARGWLNLGHNLEALVFTKLLDVGGEPSAASAELNTA